MPSISEFISKVSHGARANLFKVFINDFGMGDIELLAKAASVPGRSMGLTELKYKNNIVKIPGDTTSFAEWTITVINDETFLTRNAFEDWMEGIKSANETFSFKTNPISTSIDLFTGTAEIVCITPNDDIIGAYKLFNIFPTDLSPIDLSWDSADTIQEYTITFAYNYWIRTA